jgi:hypothetical protein
MVLSCPLKRLSGVEAAAVEQLKGILYLLPLLRLKSGTP